MLFISLAVAHGCWISVSQNNSEELRRSGGGVRSYRTAIENILHGVQITNVKIRQGHVYNSRRIMV